MTLSEYICELLYRYNCVIIPGFGAFLTKRIPATIMEEAQLFYPPKKQISFNNQIVTNDGLLANYIAKKEGISYESANFKIQQFVEEIMHELTANRSVSFSEIGAFKMSEEQKLTFEPMHTANYLTEAFGLTALKTAAIKRAEEASTVSENVISLEPIQEKQPQKNIPVLKYAAVGLLLLGISGVGLSSYKQKIDAYNTKQYVEANEEVNHQLQSASFVFEVEEVLPSILIEIEKPKASKNYHIIAGAFREYKNATKKLKQLSKKGYNAAYIGKNKYGLHQISYSSFANENEAINALNRLKRTEDSSAWLLIEKK